MSHHSESPTVSLFETTQTVSSNSASSGSDLTDPSSDSKFNDRHNEIYNPTIYEEPLSFLDDDNPLFPSNIHTRVLPTSITQSSLDQLFTAPASVSRPRLPTRDIHSAFPASPPLSRSSSISQLKKKITGAESENDTRDPPLVTLRRSSSMSSSTRSRQSSVSGVEQRSRVANELHVQQQHGPPKPKLTRQPSKKRTKTRRSSSVNSRVSYHTLATDQIPSVPHSYTSLPIPYPNDTDEDDGVYLSRSKSGVQWLTRKVSTFSLFASTTGEGTLGSEVQSTLPTTQSAQPKVSAPSTSSSVDKVTPKLMVTSFERDKISNSFPSLLKATAPIPPIPPTPALSSDSDSDVDPRIFMNPNSRIQSSIRRGVLPIHHTHPRYMNERTPLLKVLFGKKREKSRKRERTILGSEEDGMNGMSAMYQDAEREPVLGGSATVCLFTLVLILGFLALFSQL